MYTFLFTKRAQKDALLLKQAGLKDKAQKILDKIVKLPTANPAKKLSGNLLNKYSQRINIKHRIVYEILEDKKIIKVLRMWSHYE